MVHKVDPSKLCPIVTFLSFHALCFIKPRDTLCILQSFRHFLDFSALDGKSLELYVTAFIQNFNSYSFTSENSDVLPCLIRVTTGTDFPALTHCKKLNYVVAQKQTSSV
jgi:hypothetical protein